MRLTEMHEVDLIQRRSRALTLVALCAAAFVLVCAPSLAHGEMRAWRIAGGATLQGEMQFITAGQAYIKTADGAVTPVAIDQLAADDRAMAAKLDNASLPVGSPAWIDGYRLRFPIRIVGHPDPQESKTIYAKLPTGGWLTDDARDIIVVTATGRRIPHAVLAHDPLGDTLIQFRRVDNDRWYWVYIHNPQAPSKNVELEQRLESLRLSAEDLELKKMALAKVSADKAAALRDIDAEIAGFTATRDDAQRELDEWSKLLPERQKILVDASAKVPPAKQAIDAAVIAHQPFEAAAEAKTKVANEAQRVANASRAAAKQALGAYDNAKGQADQSKAALDQANQAVTAAQQTLSTAQQQQAAANQSVQNAKAASTKADADAKAAPDKDKAAAERNADRAKQAVQAAENVATQRAAAVTQATAALTAARGRIQPATADLATKSAAANALIPERDRSEGVAAGHEKIAATAQEAAKQARLAAAPTAQDLAAKRQAHAQFVAAVNAATAKVNEATQRIAASTKIRNDAKAKLAALAPKRVPIAKAAADSKTASDTAITSARDRTAEYFDLAHEADPRVYKEGLAVEFRDWAGDELDDWPIVVEGLRKSDNVIGSAIVGEVQQTVNPVRRSDPRNFAASYRGFLKVDKPGFYSFFVNGDDASFLFINGYKVYSRTGTNQPIRGRVGLYAVGSDIQLEAGVHPFEVHHVVGNTPTATGTCALLWLPPDAKGWSIVPRENLTQAMLAVPVTVEAFDGGQVAIFEFGVDDTLSADGLTLYLSRFSASGKIANPKQLAWTFGDGAAAVGDAPGHMYVKEGDYVVTLKSHAKLPAFQRRCHVWTPPTPTSPHSLAEAVSILDKTDLQKVSVGQLSDIYHFLTISGQPTRWPALERVCSQLLKSKDLDIAFRAEVYSSLMSAMASQGRGTDALELAEKALVEIGDRRTLRARLQLAIADVNRDFLREYGAADHLYAQVIADNDRLRHPIVRQAAIQWGDLFMNAGDMARAGEAYRLARELGSVGAAAASEDPVKRGALLRVAEQQLKEGNIRQTRRLLHRIEADFPEQKLEGLYRFLRGEAERNGGNYEVAIANYQILLQLSQWASYRPNAMYGIADSYYRLGDLKEAHQWLTSVEESFPEFFQARNLAPLKAQVVERFRWLEEAGNPKMFAVYENDFESADPGLNAPEGLIRKSIGFDGDHTYFLEAIPSARVGLPLPALKPMPAQGSLWIELWYRDTLAGVASSGRYISVQVRDEANAVVASQDLYPLRSFGQWHKAAFALDRPKTVSGTVTVTTQSIGGLFEIDRVRIRHVSDAQNDALRNFIEGADPQ